MKKIVIDIFLFYINMATNKVNYLHVIKHTQLIACDLIIINEILYYYSVNYYNITQFI